MILKHKRLLKAIDKFDTSYDVKFSTYAVPMITGEIKRFMRDDGIIKVSRTIKENAVKIKGVRDVLANAGNREPTVEELAMETGLSPEDVILALDSTNEVESLQKVVYQGDGGSISLMDRLVEKRDEHEEALNRILLEDLLRNLTERERELLHLRYFEEKTQTEIAGRLGLSQVQVSRMEKRLLARLRLQAQKT